jgi:biopolymer transport protein ExbD
MAFLAPGAAGHSVPRADINMIPLIDVMLVLLVIFMITAPLLTHAVKLELPKASSQPQRSTEHKVDIAIDAAGTVFWDGNALAVGELDSRLATLAAHSPQSEIHLHADRAARYEGVADVMSAAARAGLGRIAFVTEPGERR